MKGKIIICLLTIWSNHNLVYIFSSDTFYLLKSELKVKLLGFRQKTPTNIIFTPNFMNQNVSIELGSK